MPLFGVSAFIFTLFAPHELRPKNGRLAHLRAQKGAVHSLLCLKASSALEGLSETGCTGRYALIFYRRIEGLFYPNPSYALFRVRDCVKSTEVSGVISVYRP